MIAVDPLRDYNWKLGASCHMFSLDHDLEALKVFGSEIGLKLEWFHKDHFDLTVSKRKLTVARGAVELKLIDPWLIRWLRSRRDWIG